MTSRPGQTALMWNKDLIKGMPWQIALVHTGCLVHCSVVAWLSGPGHYADCRVVMPVMCVGITDCLPRLPSTGPGELHYGLGLHNIGLLYLTFIIPNSNEYTGSTLQDFIISQKFNVILDLADV